MASASTFKCIHVSDLVQSNVAAALLADISQKCGGMEEYKKMALRVSMRLKDFYTDLQLLNDKTPVPEVINAFLLILERYHLFLNHHADRHLLQRLWRFRKVKKSIQHFHEDLDHLDNKLVETLTPTLSKQVSVRFKKHEEWKDKLEHDGDKVTQKLTAIVEDPERFHELSRQKSSEDYVMMQYEYAMERDIPLAHREVLKRACSECNVELNPKDSSQPAWFVSPNDIEYYVDNESFIGEGTFGKVYRVCRAEWQHTQVVVKEISMGDAMSFRSFHRELDIWSSLNHPNVIRLFGACDTWPTYFFVSEEADGGNLLQFIEVQGRRRIWKLLYEAAAGLGYLHAKKIVHGNLKCNNILVVNEKAKISDFNFSYVRTTSVPTSVKASADSIRWKAHECLEQQDKVLRPENNPRWASDVYSFGMCIWEAFGGTPFDALSDMEIANKLLDPDFKMERPNALTSDEQWKFVQSLLQYKWQDRPALTDVIDQLLIFADNGLTDMMQGGRHTTK